MHIDGDYEYTVEKSIIKLTSFKPRFINQLDYPTSGIMALGMNRKSTGRASVYFQKRLVKKYYLALVYGNCPYQMINKPISDDKNDPKKFKMEINYQIGLEAKTLVNQLHYDENLDFSLLLLKPQTGRRHQLRLHLHSIGHSIVGDLTYRHDRSRMLQYSNIDNEIKEIVMQNDQQLYDEPRLCLHAFFLQNQAINGGKPLIATECDFLQISSINHFSIEELIKLCMLDEE